MSTPDENKQLVLAAYAAFGAQRKHEIASFFAPDAEWIVPENNGAVTALGRTRGWSGRDAIVSYLTDDVAGRLFTGSKVELKTVVADADHVVVEQHYEATVCNGRPYSIDQVFIFEVRDGLIRQVRAYFDTALGTRLIFGDETPRKLV